MYFPCILICRFLDFHTHVSAKITVITHAFTIQTTKFEAALRRSRPWRLVPAAELRREGGLESFDGQVAECFVALSGAFIDIHFGVMIQSHSRLNVPVSMFVKLHVGAVFVVDATFGSATYC